MQVPHIKVHMPTLSARSLLSIRNFVKMLKPVFSNKIDLTLLLQVKDLILI